MIHWICDRCLEKFHETNNPCDYKHHSVEVKVEIPQSVNVSMKIDTGNLKKQLCRKCEIGVYSEALGKLIKQLQDIT